MAKALGDLPLIDAALSRGEISYSKVRAMTRVATADSEETLLDFAKASTAYQLEKICRSYRQTLPANEVERARDEEDRRWVSSRRTDDGMVRITLQLRPDEAAAVMKAARVSAEAADSSSDVDGFVAMADATLRGDRPERAPVETVVRIDAATLTGELEDGTGVPTETCRRLLCDSGVVPTLEDDQGKTLDVGRKRRTIPAAILRALHMRDGCCQFPGCTHERWLDAHHIVHWSNGGETSLDNLTLTCRRHHRYLHEYGYSIRKTETGELEFIDQYGRVIPRTGERPTLPPQAVARLRQRMVEKGIQIDPQTNYPEWDGLQPDYDLCVSVLHHADPVGPVARTWSTTP